MNIVRVGLDKKDKVVPLEEAYRIIESEFDDKGDLIKETIYIRRGPEV